MVRVCMPKAAPTRSRRPKSRFIIRHYRTKNGIFCDFSVWHRILGRYSANGQSISFSYIINALQEIMRISINQKGNTQQSATSGTGKRVFGIKSVISVQYMILIIEYTFFLTCSGNSISFIVRVCCSITD